MKKLLEYKKILFILSLILLFFTMIIGFHFYHEFEEHQETVKDPVILPSDDELDFQNSSSYSDEEIISMVNERKKMLQDLFYDTPVYDLQAVDPSRSDDDNERFWVFDERFLQGLNRLVVDSLYNEVYNQMTLLKNDVSHTFYVAERDIFDFVYADSSLINTGFVSTNLRVLYASNERISSSVTFIYSDEEGALQQAIYPFELLNIQGEWKISVY